MSSAPPTDESRGPSYTVRSGLLKEYAEDRYHKQLEQRERWLAEHQHYEAIEKGLRDVSKFVYDPADYIRLLVREPFRELAGSDFSSILPERMTAAERRFRQPINVRWALMAFIIVGFAAFPALGTLFVCAVLLAGVALSQFWTLQRRHDVLARTERDTRTEIETLIRVEEAQINEQRKLHEKLEEERIEYHIRLLNGDTGAAVLKLDETLPLLRFPFPVNLAVDLFERVLLVRVGLPPKNVVPSERTILTEAGRVEYSKKDSTEINKQYAELCAATVMQVGMTIFSVLPNLSRAYFRGLVGTSDGREACLISITAERGGVEKVARANTALAAIQGLSGKYMCDEFLKLLPVEVTRPPEWADVSDKELRNLHVKIG